MLGSSDRDPQVKHFSAPGTNGELERSSFSAPLEEEAGDPTLRPECHTWVGGILVAMVGVNQELLRQRRRGRDPQTPQGAQELRPGRRALSP